MGGWVAETVRPTDANIFYFAIPISHPTTDDISFMAIAFHLES